MSSPLIAPAEPSPWLAVMAELARISLFNPHAKLACYRHLAADPDAVYRGAMRRPLWAGREVLS